jgi:hypothetical protein
MAMSFGNLFRNSSKSSSRSSAGANEITHVEKRGSNAHAIKGNGGTINLGYSNIKEVINGSGAATIVLENGSRYRYDYKTGQARSM